MKPQFKNFVNACHMSGYRRMENGKAVSPGFATRDDVLFFYPDAEFLPECKVME